MSSAGREELAGKTAVVTGASSGMGRGIAIAFSEAGADVVFTGRDLPRLEAAAAEARGNTHVLSTGEIGAVQDVSAAAVFLASDGARYMHGASLVIDGGWTVG